MFKTHLQEMYAIAKTNINIRHSTTKTCYDKKRIACSSNQVDDHVLVYDLRLKGLRHTDAVKLVKGELFVNGDVIDKNIFLN